MPKVVIPAQTVDFPEQDLSTITARITLLEAKVAALEAEAPLPVSSTLIYAPTSFWNKKLSNEVIYANSQNYANEMLANVKLAGVSINTTQYGRPIYFVDSKVTKQKVVLLADAGGSVYNELQVGIPIPPGVTASGGSDQHLCIIITTNGVPTDEYDFWGFKWSGSRWEARSCGIIHNLQQSDGTQARLPVWNTATATHLPLYGGTMMLKELEAGLIPHAISMAINRPKLGVAVPPAKTTDGWYNAANAVEEGRRFRFQASILIDPNWTPMTKMVVTAIRDYGCIVMDKTGAGVSFYSEPQVNINSYLNGKQVYQVFGDVNNPGEFPWVKLQALA